MRAPSVNATWFNHAAVIFRLNPDTLGMSKTIPTVNLRYSCGVPSSFKLRTQKGINASQTHGLTNKSTRQCQDVGVVVLARKCR
jgi:hypothetical protein